MRDFYHHEFKLEEVVSGKGASTAIQILREIEASGVKVGIIGRIATGKTTILKSIISDGGKSLSDVAGSIIDDAVGDEDYKAICGNRCKYFTAHANSVEDFLFRVAEITEKHSVGECYIIEMGVSAKKGRFISTISQVEYREDGEPVVTVLLDVHKEKYRKIVSPSLTV